jgi:hypothetical protein
MSEHYEQPAEQHEHYCRYENVINKLEKIITGNGDPNSGLCVQIALIIAKLDDLKTQMETKKTNSVSVKVALIASITSLSSILITLIAPNLFK